MRKRSVLAGLFAVLLTAVGCFNNWAVLGPEDLPQANEILTIESPTRLVIKAGETGYLGGKMMVEEDGVLNLMVEGELSVAEEAGIESRGGRVAWTHAGLLHGNDFSLTSAAGGSITVDADQGSIELDHLAILSESEGSLSWSSAGMHVNNMNVKSTGADASITETGGMQVNDMALRAEDAGALSFNSTETGEMRVNNMSLLAEDSGALSLVVGNELTVGNMFIETRGGEVAWTLEGTLDAGNVSLTNSTAGGTLTIDASRGSIDIGNIAAQNKEANALIWISTDMLVNNLNVQNYGGTTRLTDTGTMQVTNMYVKEQYDDTGSGGLTIECNDLANKNLTAVANGAGSELSILMRGQGTWQNINVDVNYGGNIHIDTDAEAVVSVENLHVDVSGASHGRLSSAELVNAGDLTVDSLLIPDGCGYEDITEPSGPPIWLITFPGDNTFTIISTGTLDMQLPL